MANNVKRVYYTQTTKDTIPASTATASVITATEGQRTFTLDTAVAEGGFGGFSWIWDSTNDKLYKVEKMLDDTSGIIQGTFSDALSDAAFAYIKTQDAKIVKLSVKANADTDVYHNGTAYTLLEGDSINDDATGIIAKFTGRSCDPALVDGTTGAVAVLYIMK